MSKYLRSGIVSIVPDLSGEILFRPGRKEPERSRLGVNSGRGSLKVIAAPHCSAGLSLTLHRQERQAAYAGGLR